jgi:hypothetical protein
MDGHPAGHSLLKLSKRIQTLRQADHTLQRSLHGNMNRVEGEFAFVMVRGRKKSRDVDQYAHPTIKICGNQ